MSAPLSEIKAELLADEMSATEIESRLEEIHNQIGERQTDLGMDEPGPLAMLQEAMAHATDDEREEMHVLKLAYQIHEQKDRKNIRSRILARRAARKKGA